MLVVIIVFINILLIYALNTCLLMPIERSTNVNKVNRLFSDFELQLNLSYPNTGLSEFPVYSSTLSRSLQPYVRSALFC